LESLAQTAVRECQALLSCTQSSVDTCSDTRQRCKFIAELCKGAHFVQNWHFVCESGLSYHVLQCCWGLVPDALNGSNVFIHSAALPKKKYISLWFFLDSLLAVKIKVLCVFEMSEITTTMTQHNIPGVLSLEQYCSETPPPKKKYSFLFSLQLYRSC
jgi:hypothetical protein